MDLRRLARQHADVLVPVPIAVLYVVELVGRGHGTDLTRAVPLALLACASLTQRRRHPLVAFPLTMVASGIVPHWSPAFDSNSISYVVVFFFALYSLGRHARGAAAWAAVPLVALMVVAFVVGDGAHGPSDVFFAMAFVGSPYAAGLTWRLRTEREQVLTARNEELRRSQEENERRAIAAERARIARELHDVVSHAISVTVLQARGGRKLVGQDDDAVRRALDAIEKTNAAALSDMRRLLAVLRDTDTDPDARQAPQPSLASLDLLLEQVRASGLQVETTVSGAPAAIPPGVDLSAYRIIQEALTNVLKHAGPQAHACVRIDYGTADLDIAVTDDGPGAAAASADGRGHGLVGIRERVAVIGGTVEAGPAEDGGFVVRAQLPYSVTA
ncbi:sensor histidine kinase [Nocardioides pocheonensis]|uniref:histidine kinase n=1 Tax=Nocardioides pocheonensis TaxID=661485 RepID=A0A3N0GW31_9ACTN|nr:sensor histidine kinase [Nocardioides pocheonensis]RNM16348.1 histidine kinase, dimerization and phosphoacceptor region [Nocardioides pocheonensis]